MKNAIYLIITVLMSVYALPKLQFHTESLSGWFGFSWLVFALIVFGGNLVTTLYDDRKPEKKNVAVRKRRREIQRG